MLFGVFDKPARSLIVNINSSNGYSSCIKCQQRGELVDFGHGQHHIFKYDKINIDQPLRTKENYNTDLLDKSNGIKGYSVLGKLEYFNPIISTNIDVMHSVFLGICKDLFFYWFDHPKSAQYSLANNIEELNKRLLSCQPPQYIPQAPRKFDDFKNWRAHEYMNFILHFSIPVFYGIMKDEYFKHLLLFVIPDRKSVV